MSKKPIFSTTKEKRLFEAKQELEKEDQINYKLEKPISTTFLIDPSLLYAVKKIALKRKMTGIKPNTVTGIIKESLQIIVDKENII